MRKYLLAALVLFHSAMLFAQTRQISGVVTDADNVPLPGVTITGPNKTSAQTATDGKFAISVPSGKVTLSVSYVGFRPQTLTVGAGQNTLTISLQTNEEQLEDVVVTALGVKRDKRSIGYATSTVKGPELTKAGVTLNPALALYGKASGVGVNIGSAGPTGSVNIRIRGAAGLDPNARTRPLFVVDGVPIYDRSTSMANTTFDPLNSIDYGTGINDINPADIESMEILKGAKATVLYGSLALNGVVLITTKSGKKAPGLGISVSQQFSIEKPYSFIDFQNEYGTGDNTIDTATVVLPNGQRVRTLRPDRWSFGPKFDGSQVMRYDSTMVPYRAYPNNFLDFFNPGNSSRTNVAISGGGAFGSVRASFSHINYDDIIDRSNQKNNTFSFNGNFNVTPFAKVEFISNIYSVTTQNRRPNIEQVVAFGLNRDYDYNFLRNFYLDDNGYRRELDAFALPPSATRLTGVLWEQNQNTDIDKKFHTISSVKTTFTLSKALSFVGQAAIDYTNVDFTTENQIVRLIPQVTGGKYQFRKLNTTVQNYQALLNFDKGFMGDDLRVFAYGGWSYRQVNEVDMFAGTGENGLRFPGWYSIGNDMNGISLDKVRGVARGSDLVYGVLGSVTLSWKNKLHLQMDARNDWNSTLPPGNNSYFYPGASVVYNFTDDLIIPQLKNGKFNVSWADIGGGPNVALQNRYFADNSYSVGSVYEGATLIGVMPPDALFLGDIKPFRKREFEVGLNTSWFNQSRINFEIAFYTNNIYDQIIPLTINPASGWPKAHINTGNVKNWGYEIALKAAPLIAPKYRWDLTFTAARQQSKVVELYEGIKEQFIDGIGSAVKVVGTIGQPHGDIYMYDYQRDPNGNKIVNANGYSIDNSKYVKVGNINPKVFGGLYSDFAIMGFNLHVGIDYKYGGKVFSYSNQYLIGNGIIESTLPFRDEEHGGLAYYIETGTNKKIPWQHNQAAPANAVGGLVYHDGMILDGVKVVTSGGTTKYETNDVIIASPTYYQSYINDNNQGWPPDRMFSNDYIKLRELAIEYTIPRKISDRLKIQRLSINAAVRNLGYIYRSIPNIDPESTLGAQGFVENSFYPSIRSFNFGVNLSF